MLVAGLHMDVAGAVIATVTGFFLDILIVLCHT